MEEEKKVVEEQKKSKLPLILLGLVLLIGVGAGCYYLGTKTDKKEETKSEEKTDKKEDKKEEQPEEKKEEQKEDTKGTDTNTSGKEILETKTKNITLNGKEYELKIETLKYDQKIEGTNDTIVSYSQNVYFNGYAIIRDAHIPTSAPTVGDTPTDYYKKAVEYELNNTKILKDSSSSDEYLVFSDDPGEAHWVTVYYYIVDTKGTTLKKLIKEIYGSSLLIYSNNPTKEEMNYYETSKYNKDYKYVYIFSDMTVVKEDSLLYISTEDWDGEIVPCDIDKHDVNIYSLKINNGKVETNKEVTIHKDDNHIFEGAGGCA